MINYQKLENVIHEEFTPGGIIEGTPRTLTYYINDLGKLEVSKYIGKGSCLNRREVINHNPLYDKLGLEAMNFCFSLGLGVYGGIMHHLGDSNLNHVIVMGSLITLMTNLGLRPVLSDIDKEIKINRVAWEKYKEYLKNNGGKNDN